MGTATGRKSKFLPTVHGILDFNGISFKCFLCVKYENHDQNQVVLKLKAGNMLEFLDVSCLAKAGNMLVSLFGTLTGTLKRLQLPFSTSCSTAVCRPQAHTNRHAQLPFHDTCVCKHITYDWVTVLTLL